MSQLSKISWFYKLKTVYRASSVGKRKESAAEHTWSCLMLADYFLSVMEKRGKILDRLRVYELLMYHDLVEIETGDVNVLHTDMWKDKKKKESKASVTLKSRLPDELQHKFVNLFNEFKNGTSVEARFAKAIDRLDGQIHELDYKTDWKGWTEKFLRTICDPVFEEFPEIKDVFEELVAYVKKNGYFNQ